MDIYNLLKNDHEEVKQMLNELIGLQPDDEYRTVLIGEIKNALIPHSRAEEAVFYNSIRSISDNAQIMHSYKEHLEAEALIRTLQMKDKTDMDWKKTAIKLQEALNHHIQEEEGNLFNSARVIFTDDEAEMMGKAFEKLKSKVAEEGFLKTSFDMVVNLMPPRFVEKVRNLKPTDQSDQSSAQI